MNRYILIVILLFVISITLSAVDTQKDNYLMFGYAANIPEQFLGFRLTRVVQNGTGFFLDLKTSLPMIESRDDFYSSISINKAENIFGDELIGKDESWTSINGGLTGFLSRKTAIYGGIGFSFYDAYRQYYDSWEILGTRGKYWIEDPDKATTKVNLLGGLIFLLDDRLGMQIGFETQPTGASIVVGLVF